MPIMRHFSFSQVESGVDELLFNLMILGSIVNSEGTVWQARETQYYIIECMPGVKRVSFICCLKGVDSDEQD